MAYDTNNDIRFYSKAEYFKAVGYSEDVEIDSRLEKEYKNYCNSILSKLKKPLKMEDCIDMKTGKSSPTI
jgi:hypothetical protein